MITVTISGPQGCGKNLLARRLAYMLANHFDSEVRIDGDRWDWEAFAPTGPHDCGAVERNAWLQEQHAVECELFSEVNFVTRRR